MSEQTALAPATTDRQLAVMPVMDLSAALSRRQALVDFTKQLMQEDVHYGKVPGTGDKPTLFKAGAEMLTTFFGLAPRFVELERIEDWTGRDHDGEPFFFYRYRCELRRGENLVGEGIGSCNSWEKKYRYRNADLKCPNCEQEGTVIKGKPEYGGGWLCWNKKGGCGSKWPDGAAEIEDQERGKVVNDNAQGLVNTIDKMAQKRALVAATLIAVNASEFFTQDVEDMDFGDVVEGSYTEKEQEPAAENGQPPNGGQTKRKRPSPDPVELGRAKARKRKSNLIPAVCEATGWHADDVKEAARQLGFESVGKTADQREKQFNTLMEFAELAEAGIEGGLILGVINGVLTREEAEKQMAEIREAAGAAADEEE